MGPQPLRPLEEGLGRGTGRRPQGGKHHPALLERLGQGARSREDHGDPELGQGRQRPAALAFPIADPLEHRVA